MGTNYPATLISLKGWLDQQISEIVGKIKLREYLVEAIETGKPSPSEVILTAEQIEHLQSELVAIDLWIIGACSFVGITPVELVEE